MVGQRFGRFFILSYVNGCGKTPARFFCACDCGNKLFVHAGSVVYGKSKSCGCLSREISFSRNIKHGHYINSKQSPEYRSWAGMHTRCGNKKDKSYKNYGGRGIEVCDEWSNFSNFLRDMGLRPFAKHSIERINNDGDYCKLNCKWATSIEQGRNKRNSRILLLEEGPMVLSAACEKYKIKSTTVCERLKKGWGDNVAVKHKIRGHK